MVYLAFAMIAAAFLFCAAGRKAPSLAGSIPPFLIGLLLGALSAAIAHLASGALRPPSVLLKAAETAVLDGLLPLLILYAINASFFRSAAAYLGARSLAGWIVPQYFGCLAICIPASLLCRFSPADPLMCLFFALAAALAASLLRSGIFRFWGRGGPARLALLLLLPLAAIALFSAALAMRFFCLPEPLFAGCASCIALALAIISLALGAARR